MSDLTRMMAPLARGLRNSIARGVLRLVDDARKLQELQVEITKGEVLDGAEHWHGYGLTSHPHPGAEALVLCLGGSRAKPVVVACADRRYRLTGLAEGEVAIHDDQGQTVVLTRAGIVITAPQGLRIEGNVTLNGDFTHTGATTQTGNVTHTGNVARVGGVSQSGALVAAGGVVGAANIGLDAVLSAYVNHKHVSASPGSLTSVPAS